jgi:hypothetical protein
MAHAVKAHDPFSDAAQPLLLPKKKRKKKQRKKQARFEVAGLLLLQSLSAAAP